MEMRRTGATKRVSEFATSVASLKQQSYFCKSSAKEGARARRAYLRIPSVVIAWRAEPKPTFWWIRGWVRMALAKSMSLAA
jgi:hypothetical protein